MNEGQMKDFVKKRKSNVMSKKRYDTIFICIMLAYPMIQFLIWYVYANFNSILLAFKAYDVDLNVRFAGFANFKEVFEQLIGRNGGQMLHGMLNSMKLYIFNLVIGLPFNIFFSYYIFKKTRLTGLFQFGLIVPTMISGMIMGLLFTKLIGDAGPINNIIAILGGERIEFMSDVNKIIPVSIFFSVWTGFASTIVIYPNAMSGTSAEVIESAKLDGANELQELWYIVLPHIYPTFTTFIVTGVAGLLTTQGPLFVFFEYNAPSEAWTMGYYLFRMVMGPGTTIHTYPLAAAAGLVLTAVAVPLTIATKYLMERVGPSED